MDSNMVELELDLIDLKQLIHLQQEKILENYVI